MAVLLLLMAMENRNNNARFRPAIFRNRPAIVQRADRPVLRRLARPFQRNR